MQQVSTVSRCPRWAPPDPNGRQGRPPPWAATSWRNRAPKSPSTVLPEPSRSDIVSTTGKWSVSPGRSGAPSGECCSCKVRRSANSPLLLGRTVAAMRLQTTKLPSASCMAGPTRSEKDIRQWEVARSFEGRRVFPALALSFPEPAVPGSFQITCRKRLCESPHPYIRQRTPSAAR